MHTTIIHTLRLRASAAAACCALATLSCAAQPPAAQPQLSLPRVRLTVEGQRIDAQVASSEAARATGLMHRRELPEGEGMLFVFERAGVQCFWMRDTLIPLTAAFILEDGRIANLADMQPLDERTHCSAAPVRYVLEMNQGWFAQRGIRAGARVRSLPGQTDDDE